jgi:2-keto-4-pentenoate hydratase
VDFALPALEIVDSRTADWDISIVDTVADSASSGLFVLGGSPVPRNKRPGAYILVEAGRRAGGHDHRQRAGPDGPLGAMTPNPAADTESGP